MEMSDMLSQDEIDALLNGIDDSSENDDSDLKVENYLSVIEQDALGEIGNISFGSAATALSTLLNQKVEITTPKVSIIEKGKLDMEFPHPHVAVNVEYTEGFEGTNLLVIRTTDAQIIADLMLGGDGLSPSDQLGEMEISAVQEAMNQMMGSASTSMSTIFNKKVDISPPGINLLDVKEREGLNTIPNEEILVKISFRLKIGDLIDSNIMQLVTVSFAKGLVEELMSPSKSEEVVMQQQTNQSEAPPIEPQHRFQEQEQQFNPKEQEIQHNYRLPEEPQHQYQMSPPPVQQQHYGANNQRAANVQPVAFSSFDPPHLQQPETKNLNMLLDIPLQVTVELGRTKRTVKDILELSQGSIIELDKLAGEPVDILVNNKLIAKGEVVVIDENFGVRVTDIVSQRDRLQNL
ncbi:flagellar motor switch phosphatase FliY [Anaerobacillus sp. MEB173]|uniref:flagellar motor switch phosphatase FliY n=1 Tax=Anaerobacillus sp. MEB173 TaxID=3383345 RepID=UPI003F8DF160